MAQQIAISDHFTVKKLLRFTFPTIIMMLFTSAYSIIDGLFVSNFAGKTPFAALNLIYPYIAILGTFGFMMGTGGSAIVAKTLGEKDRERASRYFSMLVRVTVEVGLVLTVLGICTVRPVAALFGAEGQLLNDSILYGTVVIAGLTAFMLQNAFQAFFVAAGKPGLGLKVVVLAGVTNIVLDALFIVGFGWGLFGAALATIIGQAVGGAIPLVYFARQNSSDLRLIWTKHERSVILKACVNGSSEMMTSIAASLVGMLYNLQLMRMIGEDGVAAYGIIMYLSFVFNAIFIGFSVGCSPLVSYAYGAHNRAELKNLLRKSLGLIAVGSVALTIGAQVLARPWATVFLSYDPALLAMTEQAFRLYALAFLLSGFNIFGSAFFTALNNGVVSAIISFLRTLVFECGAVIVIPMVLGVNGIWLSIVIAEVAAMIVTLGFLIGLRRVYGY